LPSVSASWSGTDGLVAGAASGATIAAFGAGGTGFEITAGAWQPPVTNVAAAHAHITE
jgi:hypothetical protein